MPASLMEAFGPGVRDLLSYSGLEAGSDDLATECGTTPPRSREDHAFLKAGDALIRVFNEGGSNDRSGSSNGSRNRHHDGRNARWRNCGRWRQWVASGGCRNGCRRRDDAGSWDCGSRDSLDIRRRRTRGEAPLSCCNHRQVLRACLIGLDLGLLGRSSVEREERWPEKDCPYDTERDVRTLCALSCWP